MSPALAGAAHEEEAGTLGFPQPDSFSERPQGFGPGPRLFVSVFWLLNHHLKLADGRAQLWLHGPRQCHWFPVSKPDHSLAQGFPARKPLLPLTLLPGKLAPCLSSFLIKVTPLTVVLEKGAGCLQVTAIL